MTIKLKTDLYVGPVNIFPNFDTATRDLWDSQRLLCVFIVWDPIIYTSMIEWFCIWSNLWSFPPQRNANLINHQIDIMAFGTCEMLRHCFKLIVHLMPFLYMIQQLVPIWCDDFCLYDVIINLFLHIGICAWSTIILINHQNDLMPLRTFEVLKHCSNDCMSNVFPVYDSIIVFSMI